MHFQECLFIESLCCWSIKMLSYRRLRVRFIQEMFQFQEICRIVKLILINNWPFYWFLYQKPWYQNWIDFMYLSCKFNIRDSRILLIINQPQLSIQQQGSLSKKFFTRQENYGPKYPEKKNFWCLMMKKLFFYEKIYVVIQYSVSSLFTQRHTS